MIYRYSDIELPKRSSFEKYKDFLEQRAKASQAMYSRNKLATESRISNYADAVRTWRSFVSRYYALDRFGLEWKDIKDPARGIIVHTSRNRLRPSVIYPLTDVGNLRKTGVGNVHKYR